MQEPQIIQADWTWTAAGFERDVQVIVGDDGRITHVGALDVKPTHRLRDRALFPGLVNAHSHAFQRGLRGRGETFPQGAGSFWTWRKAMYDLVERLDEESFYTISRRAFDEMLASGITTVGEFHYLHHDNSCTGYRFDDVIVTAALDSGIRLVLLNTFYNTGGIGKPLADAQRRFESKSLAAFWKQMDHLAHRIDAGTQSLGVAAHSIRAVDLDDVTKLHEQANSRAMVFHMHVEEQQQEIDDCVATYGQRPLATLLDRIDFDAKVTAVHCTHTTAADLARLAATGGNVCMCPLTEANLGDGIADVPAMMSENARVCIGTDSNARISMTEELRWLEYAQRLRHELRGICADQDGNASAKLMQMATEHGATALGLDAGRIEAGRLADFVAIDLAAPAMLGWSEDEPSTILDSLIFGTGNEAITATCVGGRWLSSP